MSEGKFWECEDVAGHKRKAEPEELAATTWEGYGILEIYIDAKEKKVRDLERQLSQCGK